jgi:hypothetical protein
MSVRPMSGDELDKLSVRERVGRMDGIRIAAELERYPYKVEAGIPLLQELCDTLDWRCLPEVQQRRSVDSAFRFLLQMDLCSMASGNMNAICFNRGYSDASWHSPGFQIAHASFVQYRIVGSRIALECFFDLLHILDKGERLPGKRKFKAFRQWMLKDKSRFVYFLGHIVAAHRFDREQRTPEVHATSALVRRILEMRKPDDRVQQATFDLSNVLLSVWQPMLRIMNRERPTTISIFDDAPNFAAAYFGRDDAPESFDGMVRELAERMVG